MVTKEEMNKAFRIAYDAMADRLEPEYTKEYFMGASGDFSELVKENSGNKLLPFLLVAVYDYLAYDAKEKNK